MSKNWTCPACLNINHARQTFCHRCHASYIDAQSGFISNSFSPLGQPVSHSYQVAHGQGQRPQRSFKPQFVQPVGQPPRPGRWDRRGMWQQQQQNNNNYSNLNNNNNNTGPPRVNQNVNYNRTQKPPRARSVDSSVSSIDLYGHMPHLWPGAPQQPVTYASVVKAQAPQAASDLRAHQLPLITHLLLKPLPHRPYTRPAHLAPRSPHHHFKRPLTHISRRAFLASHSRLRPMAHLLQLWGMVRCRCPWGMDRRRWQRWRQQRIQATLPSERSSTNRYPHSMPLSVLYRYGGTPQPSP